VKARQVEAYPELYVSSYYSKQGVALMGHTTNCPPSCAAPKWNYIKRSVTNKVSVKLYVKFSTDFSCITDAEIMY